MTIPKWNPYRYKLTDGTDAAGRFEGYASVFDITDAGNDMVLQGAFKKSLENLGAGEGGVKLLWRHDIREQIGVIDELYEDHYGLFVRGRVLQGTAQSREVLQMLATKVLDGLSIGYHTLKAIQLPSGVCLLKEVDLQEISLVPVPMNTLTRVTNFYGSMCNEKVLL